MNISNATNYKFFSLSLEEHNTRSSLRESKAEGWMNALRSGRPANAFLLRSCCFQSLVKHYESGVSLILTHLHTRTCTMSFSAGKNENPAEKTKIAPPAAFKWMKWRLFRRYPIRKRLFSPSSFYFIREIEAIVWLSKNEGGHIIISQILPIAHSALHMIRRYYRRFYFFL